MFLGLKKSLQVINLGFLMIQMVEGLKKNFTASEIDVVEYLIHLVNINSSYSVINTHTSMQMQTLPFLVLHGVIIQL